MTTDPVYESLEQSVLLAIGARQDGGVKWAAEERGRLEAALNEAEVVGVRLDPEEHHVDVLLHVISLPPSGPLVRDGRRILRLTSPSELRFLLRADRVGERVADNPALPVVDLASVEAFFESLSWGGSIYGWRFFDDPELTLDWPEEPSLIVRLQESSSGHTFYWFNECGIDRDGKTLGYCLEGTVAFEDIRILDAFGSEIPIQTFIADGLRQWEAFYTHDDRLSLEAQRESQQGAPKWRNWATVGQSAMGTP